LLAEDFRDLRIDRNSVCPHDKLGILGASPQRLPLDLFGGVLSC